MRWSYKTVRFDMKKEGILGSAFLDESEIEMTLNEFGSSGWEVVSLMEVQDGIIAVFKQPFAKGAIPVEEYPDEEEQVVAEAVGEPRPIIRESESIDPEKEEYARRQTLQEGSEETGSETDDTDVGSIRIE